MSDEEDDYRYSSGEEYSEQGEEEQEEVSLCSKHFRNRQSSTGIRSRNWIGLGFIYFDNSLISPFLSHRNRNRFNNNGPLAKSVCHRKGLNLNRNKASNLR